MTPSWTKVCPRKYCRLICRGHPCRKAEPRFLGIGLVQMGPTSEEVKRNVKLETNPDPISTHLTGFVPVLELR